MLQEVLVNWFFDSFNNVDNVVDAGADCSVSLESFVRIGPHLSEAQLEFVKRV